MQKNDQFEIDITDISDEGAGIGRACGLVWFIKDTLPGDRVLAAATKLKKSYGFARLIQVLRPSLDRTEPLCPVARQCGGCQLQAMCYEAQLRFKENRVKNALQRIGGFAVGRSCTSAVEAAAWKSSALETDEFDGTGTVLMEPIIGMEEPFRYRNKAQFPIRRSRDGRIIAGFFAGRTHAVIACGDCLLGCRENRLILDCVIAWMEKWKLEPYDEQTGTGLVRHVLIRKAAHTGELMVCIVINAEKLPHKQELCEALRGLSFPEEDGKSAGIASISYNINCDKTNVILGQKLIDLFGPGYIEDSIRRLFVDKNGQFRASETEKPVRFHISPLSFYQVNPRQTERLYSTALSYAGLTGNETVWDLYCGIGTISLFLARHAKKVYGVEIIPQAIENAWDNAELNGISNAEFFVGKAEEVLPAWAKEKNGTETVDVIVVDPPRKGCDAKCLETIAALSPKRIVYVSCDPATLARDLKYLCANGYALQRVRPCDMFGQSVHVETVCLLTRIK